MANVQFLKGKFAKLPQTKTEGTLYAVTDERALYLDVSSSERVRFGDFQVFTSLTALNAADVKSKDILYFTEDTAALYRYDGSKFVQINKDTGFTSVDIDGDGNAVTEISYDPDSRKLAFSKNETFATQGDIVNVESKISGLSLKVGDDPVSKQISDAIGELDTDKWDEAADDVDAVKADYLKSADKANLEGKINAKQDTISFQTSYDASSNKAATMADVASAVAGLSGAMHWIGTKSSIPNSNEGYNTGDVITVSGKEYAFDGSSWVELGDESMYSDKVDSWNTAASQAHTHTNGELLDSYDQTNANIKDAVDKKHTHTNSTVLDKISDTTLSDISDAKAKAHTHTNSAELDKIDTGDKTKWDNAATDVAAIKADYLDSDDKSELEAEIAKNKVTSGSQTGDAVQVTVSDGKVSAAIKNDSITEDMLDEELAKSYWINRIEPTSLGHVNLYYGSLVSDAIIPASPQDVELVDFSEINGVINSIDEKVLNAIGESSDTADKLTLNGLKKYVDQEVAKAGAEAVMTWGEF